MPPELWTPGAAMPSLDEFVTRIVRQIERFAARRGWEQAVVEVQLHDGTRFALHSLSPEPGFGYVTLCPYPEDEARPWPRAGTEEAVPPEELILPVGSIVRITLGEPEEQRSRFGFSVPETG